MQRTARRERGRRTNPAPDPCRRLTRSLQIHPSMKVGTHMAKQDKGQERAREWAPRWRPPAAEDIKPGDVLQFFSIDTRFTFQVLSLQHGGEWIFGRDTRDAEGSRTGPIAVKRTDCMTLSQASTVLRDFPLFQIEAPDPDQA